VAAKRLHQGAVSLVDALRIDRPDPYQDVKADAHRADPSAGGFPDRATASSRDPALTSRIAPRDRPGSSAASSASRAPSRRPTGRRDGDRLGQDDEDFLKGLAGAPAAIEEGIPLTEALIEWITLNDHGYDETPDAARKWLRFIGSSTPVRTM